MRIVPVLDLLGGVAVHARQGRRHEYRPMQSPLCASSDPFEVLRAYLGLHPFPIVYIADLDGITGKIPQFELIRSLQQAYPQLQFWVDAGWPVSAELPWVPVIGSESLDSEFWHGLKRRSDEWILSLDYLEGRLLGPPAVMTECRHGSQRVIHMNLNRVGSGEGPDVDGLRQLLKHLPGQRVIAAGGVRGVEDVNLLEGLGIGHALVASALHSGALYRRA